MKESSMPAYRIAVHLDFPDLESAAIAARTLSVDPPPPRSSVTQTFRQEERTLVCECVAPLSDGTTKHDAAQLGKLRIAARAVVDLACLVLETVEAFKPV
ncbi:transcription factor Pcc1 [Opisthorchis viverrini]|uniref:Transcription factor Pcc1 n=1 Tax=Opisthorchis viverrini TaxID=6198 RepID=A0A1S8WTC9_OPIVI|nr:transcription factor Pcc1 [Opisthorchis viverrini]